MTKELKNFAIAMMLFTLLNRQNIHAQPLTVGGIKTQMVKDWMRAKVYTIDYLKTMPASKYSFKAVDSIRSFSQQMLHLAEGNFFLLYSASDIDPPAAIPPDLEHRTGAQTKDSVMYYVNASYEYCIAAINAIDIARWGELKTIPGFTAPKTRFTLINEAFEHQTHHRGQTTIYIRLQGIKPPEENLF